MAIRAYELETPDGCHTEGVVLVDSVKGLPLVFETGWLNDLEDAERFLEWAARNATDKLTKLGAPALSALGEFWTDFGRDADAAKRALAEAEEARS